MNLWQIFHQKALMTVIILFTDWYSGTKKSNAAGETQPPFSSMVLIKREILFLFFFKGDFSLEIFDWGSNPKCYPIIFPSQSHHIPLKYPSNESNFHHIPFHDLHLFSVLHPSSLQPFSLELNRGAEHSHRPLTKGSTGGAPMGSKKSRPMACCPFLALWRDIKSIKISQCKSCD